MRWDGPVHFSPELEVNAIIGHGREVALEESGDAPMGIAGGRLVVAGAGDLRQDHQQRCHIGRVVVVDEPVTGARWTTADRMVRGQTAAD